MAKYRSKEDDVNRILILIFVLNFPKSFSAKDLFHTCKQYGHVVDSFIPSKRTKEARFQRKPLNEMNTSAKTMGENNRGGDKSSRSFGEAMGSELSYSLMGRVKKFALLTNLKTTLLNEGFVDLSVRYLGELWVLLKFSSSKTKEAFSVNVGESEEEEQSDVGSLEGDNKMNEDDLCGDNMDMTDVPETIFDESNGQKKDVS
nr:hypothetical protein [Tanacetum cinerariifolium]